MLHRGMRPRKGAVGVEYALHGPGAIAMTQTALRIGLMVPANNSTMEEGRRTFVAANTEFTEQDRKLNTGDAKDAGRTPAAAGPGGAVPPQVTKMSVSISIVAAPSV